MCTLDLVSSYFDSVSGPYAISPVRHRRRTRLGVKKFQRVLRQQCGSLAVLAQSGGSNICEWRGGTKINVLARLRILSNFSTPQASLGRTGIETLHWGQRHFFTLKRSSLVPRPLPRLSILNDVWLRSRSLGE